jgi:hypothetical protein
MSTSSCAGVRERAPDLALGTLTGPERADVVAHLDGCSSCQALVGEYVGRRRVARPRTGGGPATELAPPSAMQLPATVAGAIESRRSSPQPHSHSRPVRHHVVPVACTGAEGLHRDRRRRCAQLRWSAPAVSRLAGSCPPATDL